MSRALTVALALLAPLALPVAARAQRPSGETSPASNQQFTQIFQSLLTANEKRDTVAMKQLFATGYTFVPVQGDTILTGAQRLRWVAADTTTQTYSLHGCRSEVFGDAAVAHCRFSATGGAGEDSTRELISTAVFVRRDGQWKIAATHPSVVTPRAP
ncbi:MAG TPA: nuclear transport factor 2 family protein [Gemmatimonadaceae bacterium]|nr:nuclear transport factor 2 family protein [Gemmatimonadaceae bacterium]